jgi:hypothetical protein
MVFLNNAIFFCSKKRYSSHAALFFFSISPLDGKEASVEDASCCCLVIRANKNAIS